MNSRQHGRQGRVTCATPHTLECLTHQSSQPVLVSFQTREAGSMVPALRRISRALTGRLWGLQVDVTEWDDHRGALTVGEYMQPWLRGVSHRSREDPMANVTKEAKRRARRVLRRQQRTCLRCDRTFMSAGSHNRLCDACRGALAVASTPEEEYSMVFFKASSTGQETVI
jgi:hypothetical protein